MTTSSKMVTNTYCLANGANMLVFSSVTTSYGFRSGSGSTGWRFMIRASRRSTILRAWSVRPLASSQRGDSGSRQMISSITTRFSPPRNHR